MLVSIVDRVDEVRHIVRSLMLLLIWASCTCTLELVAAKPTKACEKVPC